MAVRRHQRTQRLRRPRMRPRRNLVEVKRSGLLRVARIRTQAVASIPSPSAGTHRIDHRSIDRAIAFAVIELDNLWAGVARSLFLSAAFCARDASGTPLKLSKVPKAASADEALTHAIRRCRGARYKSGSSGPWRWRDEPFWWDPATLLDSLDEIGASNHQQVTLAVNAYPDVFSHLHVFRNFYAHRGIDTRRRLLSRLLVLQVPTTHSATLALASPDPRAPLPRPQPLIFDWLDDVRETIGLLV